MASPSQLLEQRDAPLLANLKRALDQLHEQGIAAAQMIATLRSGQIAAVDSLVGQITGNFSALFTDASAIVEALRAGDYTSADVTGPVTFTPAPLRELHLDVGGPVGWSPAPAVLIGHRGSTDDIAIARVLAWDPGTTTLSVEIVSNLGETGPHSDCYVQVGLLANLAESATLSEVVSHRNQAVSAKESATSSAASALASAALASASASAASVAAALLEASAAMPSLADVEAAQVPAAIQRLTIGGTGTQMRRVASEPTSGVSVRSADRYLPDGDVDADNGGWWLEETLERLESPNFSLTAPWAGATTAPAYLKLTERATSFDFLSHSVALKVQARMTGEVEAPYITEQFQAIFDAGIDVEIVPGLYTISEKLTLAQPRCTYSGAGGYSEFDSGGGPRLKFIGDREGDYAIDLSAHQPRFRGLVFNGTDRATVNAKLFRFAKDTNSDDIDAFVEDCFITNFKSVADVFGRSLRFTDNTVALCDDVLKLSWPSDGEDYTADLQGPPWGNRAWVIQRNRAHSVGKFCGIERPAEANLPIRAMLFTHNVLDAGRCLLTCANDMFACDVSHNIAEHCTSTPISVTGDVSDTRLTGNTLNGRIADLGNSPAQGADFQGAFENSQFVGNHIAHTDSHGARFRGGVTGGSEVCANHFRDIGMDAGSGDRCLHITGAIADSVIGPNYVYSMNNGAVLGLFDTPIVSRSRIIAGPMPSGGTFLAGSFTDGGGNSIVRSFAGQFAAADGGVGFGAEPASNRRVTIAYSGAIPLRLQRAESSSGVGIEFANAAGALTMTGVATGVNAGEFSPSVDNAIDLGSGSRRIKNAFFANAPTVGSDQALKTAGSMIPEELLDAWEATPKRMFKLLSSVAEKGAEAARWHIGIIAQEFIAACATRGVDPGLYGLLCREEWAAHELEAYDEETGEAKLEVVPAGQLYFVRYEEASQLDAAVFRRALQRLSEEAAR
ncbi:tail fiber domain-containing protein [Shinella sp.]|uniref:tail fiber domain-containing protein n=1 Tax=Shinella sp. TaxID=1870904 RepID=UPI002590DB61|nr:tail fiber domain-containing protein [Shinella sp.]MCW5712746.1 tail fiber domain-containing protein [Shinella sp.]